MKKQRITRKCIQAAIGHMPHKRTFRYLKVFKTYVDRMCKKYPDVPRQFWWDDVRAIVVRAIEERTAEG